MLKSKTKTAQILLAVSLLIINVTLIIAEALASNDGLLSPKFNLNNPIPLIVVCVSFLITDGLIMAFIFKARGVGMRIFVAIVIFLSAIHSFLWCSTSFTLPWTSETTDTEDFLVMDESANLFVKAYIASDFLSFDVSEIIEYNYYFKDNYEIVIDIKFTARLTPERYATFKTMLADHEDATVIEQKNIIEFYFDQRFFDKELGDGVKLEIEFSDEACELHYKFWYQCDTM